MDYICEALVVNSSHLLTKHYVLNPLVVHIFFTGREDKLKNKLE
jgi:hypothetical protein